MRAALQEVLLLQRNYAPRNSEAMARRGHLIHKDIADQLKARLGALSSDPEVHFDDLRVQASNATGLYSEIPWVRVHPAAKSPSATVGWYVVYLFDSPGETVYLCLMQGTSRWQNNAFKTRPVHELHERVAWARTAVADQLKLRADLVHDIHLKARGRKLAPGYEAGTVAAFAYPVDAIPSDQVLAADLRFLVATLSTLYTALEQAPDVPGEPAPEIAEVVEASHRAAGRRTSRGQGRRLSVEERTAIERRAVDVATAHLEEKGYRVKDVGATQPYDLDATRQDEHLHVEVKGTTSSGVEVVLTQGEVLLNREKYPDTALMVVRSIRLEHVDGGVTASGGELHVTHPWAIDDADLTPISHRYVVPG
ncbi:DUF3578 domain-containing protein [Lentzea sp. NPDC042327]|uniref:MrcB family domain-containing protein n=1 Tax=Lentzea sp. NPDC042327 TaxID=3154801 RepID=UPI0033EEBD35